MFKLRTSAAVRFCASQASSTSADGATDQVQYDPWKVLGLKEGASAHDIRLRYHELLKEHHPDYVEAGKTPDMDKLHEIEQAYQHITKAPTIDRRYRNLVSNSQYVYYKFLPQWMARNVDEMPRYWSWLKWRIGGVAWWFTMMGMAYVMGYIATKYPKYVFAASTAFLFDCLFHTNACPPICIMVGVMAIFSGDTYDMAWFSSPKGFLTKPLTY
jgi:hypothetical protein